jgi:hypothetical protein
MQKPFDNCTNLQGFVAFHVVSGGNSFGLNTLLHQCLLVDYGKNSKLPPRMTLVCQAIDECGVQDLR